MQFHRPPAGIANYREVATSYLCDGSCYIRNRHFICPGRQTNRFRRNQFIGCCRAKRFEFVHQAAGTAEENSRQPRRRQKLSLQLQSAEDRIKDLEADVRYFQERAERAEQWLSKFRQRLSNGFSELPIAVALGTDLNTKRLRGRCARGERLIDHVPHGHWKTITFVAGLRRRAMVAPLVLDRPMNATTFVAYLKQCLVPKLKRGDVVMMDSLPVHRVANVREVIEAAGANYVSSQIFPGSQPDRASLQQTQGSSPKSC